MPLSVEHDGGAGGWPVARVGRPFGSPLVEDLRQRVGRDAGLVGEDLGRLGGRGSAEHDAPLA